MFLVGPAVELKLPKAYSGPGHTVKAIVSAGAQGFQALDLECRRASAVSTCFLGNCRAMLDEEPPKGGRTRWQRTSHVTDPGSRAGRAGNPLQSLSDFDVSEVGQLRIERSEVIGMDLGRLKEPDLLP